ncbi:MAG: hypothetical protein IIC13_05960 [SAR324 cluster bacterium]|nr:hypothetical protein [SAR324 cluster bacterium]
MAEVMRRFETCPVERSQGSSFNSTQFIQMMEIASSRSAGQGAGIRFFIYCLSSSLSRFVLN